MVFVSIARLRIRLLRFMPAFIADTFRTPMQLRRVGGFVTGSLLADRNFTFWAMAAFELESVPVSIPFVPARARIARVRLVIDALAALIGQVPVSIMERDGM